MLLAISVACVHLETNNDASQKIVEFRQPEGQKDGEFSQHFVLVYLKNSVTAHCNTAEG
jgi:hypothetical protein